MKFQLTYKSFGPRAILIEWPQKIDESILFDILTFKKKIQDHYINLNVEVINAYCSISIIYDSTIRNIYKEFSTLKELYKYNDHDFKPKSKKWKIPVCYDLVFGIDLHHISEYSELEIEEIIRLHFGTVYKIYFIGFLPGFLYMGGIHKKLFIPRRSSPRMFVEKGSVAIGNKQTGIYPINSPGGWHIIGRTPINMFDLKSSELCFASPADHIEFIRIDKKEFFDIKEKIEKGQFELQNERI